MNGSAPTTALSALSRRGFLSTSAAAGGAFVLSFCWPARTTAGRAGTPPADFAPNAFVRIAADGRVTIVINKAEMGQGVSTSMAMVLADELDADWSKVAFEFAPVDAAYAHPGYGMQFTGGSTSTLAMTLPMRMAGACARAMLVAAASKQWGVPAAECRTANGTVAHGSGRSARYGELAAAAATLPVPDQVPLKEPAQWRLIGKPTHRLDSRSKVDGTAQFAIDVRPTGVKTALVLHPPTFGGKARSFRDAEARAVPGVLDVVDVGSGIAVIGTGFWACKRGRDLLEVDWDLGPAATLSSAQLRADYRRLAAQPGLVARKDGDPDRALGAAARRFDADYELPYLAHAPMEPLNCVVDLRAESCEVWAGTQFQTFDHAAICRESGLQPAQVKLHTTFLGGGFGRRACPTSDYVVEAVKVAKASKAPLQLIWTREDDMRAGYYRPMWHSRVRAGVDRDGAITSWLHTIVGQSITAGTPFASFTIKDGIDNTSVEGAEDLPYAIPNVQVDLHTTTVAVPTLWWRSVGHSHTAFVVETFLDELALATGKDPLGLRRALLAGKPRHRGALDLAAEQAGWQTPLPRGHGRGLAVHCSFGSYVAVVVEASVQDRRPRVHRCTLAVDCGLTVNPDTVLAQLQGAVGFGLTAALYGEITLQDGRVEQSNFHDYRMLRMHEMPAVDVHIVPSSEPSSGVGEPGVPPVAPALCNALFAVTGKRIRRLPIRAEDLA